MTQTLEAPEQLPAKSGNGAMQRLNPNALASDTATLKGYLEQSRDKLAMVLPRHLTPEKLIRVALVAISRSELLQKCTVPSILQCVMTGGQLGLDCSGVLGSAYMVPFYNKKIRAYEATFIPGYRGLIDLARRTGEIDDIYAHPVYRNDAFDLELGATPKLYHKPNYSASRADTEIVGAYMVAFLKGNQRPHVEFMPWVDIVKIRDSSKGYLKDEYENGQPTGRKKPSGPWHDHLPEMCRKTVVRRGIKYLPMSVEMAEAIALDDKLYDRDDETQVLSASTGSRTENLLKKITSRPVSESQQFVPDDSAVAQAEQELQQEPAGVNTQTGEVAEPDVGPTENPPEPSEIGDHAGKAAAAAVMIEELSEQEWPHFVAGLYSRVKDQVPEDVFKSAITKLTISIGKKGKEPSITKDAKKSWATAALAGQIDWQAGRIVKP